MNPDISYIVICFNSENYVLKCINSILNQSHTNNEIILVDNNSTDDTISTVKGLCIKNNIKLISNTTNLGYSNAIAMAIEKTKGEFLAILNADSFLDANWASNLLKAFRSDEKIMSASGKVLFPNGELQSSGGMMDKYGAVVQRDGKIFNSRKIHDNSFFFYNDGSSFMIRRKIFQETSFDPNLFLYYEDVDLSWKIRMLGYKIAYVPEAISYHYMGQSIPDMTLSKFYHITRNRIYVCHKNYSPRNIICRIPIMLFLIFLSTVFYDTKKRSTGYMKAFFKAIFWNIVNLGSARREQRKLRLKNKLSDKELDSYLISKSIELDLIRNKSNQQFSI